MSHDYTETDHLPACTCGETFDSAAAQWGHQMAVEA